MLKFDVTQLLCAWRTGDRAAFDSLVGATYEDLRRLARSHLRRERPGHTLTPTGLVHEVWLRMANQREGRFLSRAHFFGAASHSMRRVLVGHARARLARKRRGEQLTLSAVEATSAVTPSLHDIVAIDAALDRLSLTAPRLVRVVECRCFAGLTIPETAEALGVSHTTVSEDWRFARAWLHRELSAKPGRLAA